MPIYEYLCLDCGKVSELLLTAAADQPECAVCRSRNVKKLISASSTASGSTGGPRVPGHGDTSCCGQTPAAAGCAGPGSCCGKLH